MPMSMSEADRVTQVTYELLDSKLEFIRQTINAEGSMDIRDLRDKIEVMFENVTLPDEFHNDIFEFIGMEELADYIQSRKIGNVQEVYTYMVYKRLEKKQ